MEEDSIIKALVLATGWVKNWAGRIAATAAGVSRGIPDSDETPIANVVGACPAVCLNHLLYRS